MMTSGYRALISRYCRRSGTTRPEAGASLTVLRTADFVSGMRRSASIVLGGRFGAGAGELRSKIHYRSYIWCWRDGKAEEVAKYALYIRFTQNHERRLETRPVHREYLKALYEDGKLIEAGPFTDDSGALLIYEVENREAAEAQFAADPYSITGGIVESVTFDEWNRVFSPLA